MMSLRNSAIAMRYDFEGRLLEVVDSAVSRPCDVVGGPSSALVIRACVSRSESFAICGGRARWTACAGEFCAVGSDCAKGLLDGARGGDLGFGALGLRAVPDGSGWASQHASGTHFALMEVPSHILIAS